MVFLIVYSVAMISRSLWRIFEELFYKLEDLRLFLQTRTTQVVTF